MISFVHTLRRRLQTIGTLTLGFAGIALGANLPAEWEKKESPPDIEIFSSKKVSGTETITFLERKGPSAPRAPRSAEELKTKAMEKVNRQLEPMGIHDWKVTSAQAIHLPQGKLFKLRGSYIGVVNQKVYFEEWKLYLKNGFAQITFSEEGKANPSLPEYVETLMKQFQPLGEKL